MEAKAKLYNEAQKQVIFKQMDQYVQSTLARDQKEKHLEKVGQNLKASAGDLERAESDAINALEDLGKALAKTAKAGRETIEGSRQDGKAMLKQLQQGWNVAGNYLKQASGFPQKGDYRDSKLDRKVANQKQNAAEHYDASNTEQKKAAANYLKCKAHVVLMGGDIQDALEHVGTAAEQLGHAVVDLNDQTAHAFVGHLQGVHAALLQMTEKAENAESQVYRETVELVLRLEAAVLRSVGQEKFTPQLLNKLVDEATKGRPEIRNHLKIVVMEEYLKDLKI
jgi:hypothetical protein